ncbi:3-oxo-5-alpha-steroid 4-dehydrogenase [Blastomyces dermatitidis ER-3]|uniref:Polyprenal reductase n=2 Tax=Ajellomyces dermatitidis TaxID=5039 RepID=F2TKN7_AJEDA|nr:3-oxo-5-alpha-steroid 4-dehydrogenase [Blastomyces dermatitidis ER-3]EEQ83728.1 3-oxo-5-alpha-steroid 4-dehydrogenase [Blastomyces dermatitidis ER-3]EGE83800.1 3-oxo-5-alpha-steroid 4-dehydrogenase [Blastomyces dermatitidis ATCC 18188]
MSEGILSRTSMEFFQWTYSLLQTIDVLHLLRGFFLITACTILLANSAPFVRSRFIAYGPRATSLGSIKPPQNSEQGYHTVSQRPSWSWSMKVLDYLASLQVPHSFFTQFYVVSVLSSILWGTQIYFKGPLFKAVSSTVRDDNAQTSMSRNQIVLCWTLLLIQGTRRLYESISTAKPSQSKMWFPHWIVGLAYYVAMGMAIWVEGIPVIRASDNLLSDVRYSAPSLKTLIFLPVFILASGIQHDCHLYLASLKKYTLPSHPGFLHLVSPHYTAECAIYLSLVFLAAPKGTLVNNTVLSGLVFVVINLGISADNTKAWYMKKFGKEKVEQRWRMIPYLY